MSRPIIDLNHSTANNILKIAWAIEIIAALVSFSIGFFLVFGDTGLSTGETLRKGGYISGLFLFLYGIFRFTIEFIREPDLHIGLIFNFLSAGQLLCIPLIFFGIILLVKKKKYA